MRKVKTEQEPTGPVVAYDPRGDVMVYGVPMRRLTPDEFGKFAERYGRAVMLKAFTPVHGDFKDVKTEVTDGSL